MVYARPQNPLRETGGHGVLLDIAWYREDPGDDPDKIINVGTMTTALLYAPSAAAVTPEMIEDAIAEHRPMAEAELNPPPTAPPNVTRAVLGRVYDAGQIAMRAQARKAAKGERL